MTLEETWTTCLSACGYLPEAERRALLAQGVAEDAAFTNSGNEGRGRADLARHIPDFHAKMPRFHFRSECLIADHGALLAARSLHRPDGAEVARGHNFARPDEESRWPSWRGSSDGH